MQSQPDPAQRRPSGIIQTNCEVSALEIELYWEGEILDPDRIAFLEQHLLSCCSCQEALAQEEQFHLAIQEAFQIEAQEQRSARTSFTHSTIGLVAMLLAGLISISSASIKPLRIIPPHEKLTRIQLAAFRDNSIHKAKEATVELQFASMSSICDSCPKLLKLLTADGDIVSESEWKVSPTLTVPSGLVKGDYFVQLWSADRDSPEAEVKLHLGEVFELFQSAN